MPNASEGHHSFQLHNVNYGKLSVLPSQR